ncbi:HAD family hydrolase [uncultured Gemmiger sp.]|uniref:HAD family hydrolase n=1 Tax=uncultured Gemmiger sp. TaxID=1623490 RepID=UPI0025E5429E|nr:HAD family hydrolase [uncultured Gemmiger sp.]
MTQLILWDWNGTLLDDVALCVDALNRLLARYGYARQYDLKGYRKIFGFPIRDYYLRAGFDFSRHSFDELAKSYMDDYIPASAACPLMPGARETLARLQAAGCRQVILSASPITTLQSQAEQRGVLSYFDQLLGLGDIYAKSKVELGLNYLHRERFDPDTALMVGDSVHDFEVSRALGVRCLLYAGGHQDAAALAATGAPVVESLAAVADRVLHQPEGGGRA